MTTRLKNSIEELYAIFSRYGGNPNMEGSPNYDNVEKWNKDLFSTPLRELGEQDLVRFTGKAITTWGSPEDYKHFLPRIFELIAELRAPYEIWIAFDKLNLADWHQWPEMEQRIIHRYMMALWESILNDDGDKAEWEFDEYFSSLAHFYPNFTVLLQTWHKEQSKAAIKHLAEFLIKHQIKLFERTKIPGFHDQTENAVEFISWVLSDQTLKKLQQKYFEFEMEVFADKISWAEQILTDRRQT